MDNLTLVLGSKSPRRQALIQELGFPVEVRLDEIEEIYPDTLTADQVPEYLARLKAQPLIGTLQSNEILVTSDTVVLLDGKVMGKPKNAEDAVQMLHRLSGEQHSVISGVSLISLTQAHSFSSRTEVYFSVLTDAEINHYVEKFAPLDKAGSYGIQEWIGYVGVSKIEGCYYNVMGLPLHDVYHAVKTHFIQ